MQYKHIIGFLHRGGMVQRSSWADRDLINDNIWVPKCLIYENRTLLLQEGKNVIPYTLTQEDINADDWLLV